MGKVQGPGAVGRGLGPALSQGRAGSSLRPLVEAAPLNSVRTQIGGLGGQDWGATELQPASDLQKTGSLCGQAALG